MENLQHILNILKKKRDSHKGNYFIPGAWNFSGYDKCLGKDSRSGEINVNPYDYYANCIENHILPYAYAGTSYLHSLSPGNADMDFSPNKSIIYSMFPRMFTAWNHAGNGEISPGKFLKALCMLPYLKNFNVDIVYLLPVFECSERYKKGEASSPYAIKNLYKPDKNLHDPLLGEYEESILETEFKAFIEACHILGMKVMVDFVFRTVSRDNDLIVEHPDWFYWIDVKYSSTFSAPVAEKLKKPVKANEKTVSYLYRSRKLKEYLAQFTCSPDKIDFARWEKLVKRHRQTGENILDMVEAEFNITTAPAFSDVINDPQPQWSDVTFLKFYFDVHHEARKYIGKNQPPYIMQDGVSLNIFSGQSENRELMEYISGVIPFFQERFGVDGARIDMGHVLPPDLIKEIISRAKSINRNFILWSEEFDLGRSGEIKKHGFHFMSGYIWSIYKNLEKPAFNKMLIADGLLKAEIPIIAALETPDTPRAALVFNNKRKLALLVFLNCFVPNTIPFINNGMEVMEIQPMNLGLDNNEEGRFVLDGNDPMYGKLAFFDNYRVHWKNGDREWMGDLLQKALAIRKAFADILSEKENYIKQPDVLKNKKIIFICYFDKKTGRGVFFLANRDLRTRARINLKQLLPPQVQKTPVKIELAYAGDYACGSRLLLEQRGLLGPGEVVIGSMQRASTGSGDGNR